MSSSGQTTDEEAKKLELILAALRRVRGTELDNYSAISALKNYEKMSIAELEHSLRTELSPLPEGYFDERFLSLSIEEWNGMSAEEQEEELLKFWSQTSREKFPLTFNLVVLPFATTDDGTVVQAIENIFPDKGLKKRKACGWLRPESHQKVVYFIWMSPDGKSHAIRGFEGARSQFPACRGEIARKALKTILGEYDFRILAHVSSKLIVSGDTTEHKKALKRIKRRLEACAPPPPLWLQRTCKRQETGSVECACIFCSSSSGGSPLSSSSSDSGFILSVPDDPQAGWNSGVASLGVASLDGSKRGRSLSDDSVHTAGVVSAKSGKIKRRKTVECSIATDWMTDSGPVITTVPSAGINYPAVPVTTNTKGGNDVIAIKSEDEAEAFIDIDNFPTTENGKLVVPEDACTKYLQYYDDVPDDGPLNLSSSAVTEDHSPQTDLSSVPMTDDSIGSTPAFDPTEALAILFKDGPEYNVVTDYTVVKCSVGGCEFYGFGKNEKEAQENAAWSAIKSVVKMKQ